MCTPALTVASLATRWALVFEHWDYLGTVWLAKGAPRRWYSTQEGEGGFSIASAPTRYGFVSYNASTSSLTNTSSTSIMFAPPPYGKPPSSCNSLTLVVRMRYPPLPASSSSSSSSSLSAYPQLQSASISGSGASYVTVVSVNPANETVIVLMSSINTNIAFTINAVFA